MHLEGGSESIWNGQCKCVVEAILGLALDSHYFATVSRDTKEQAMEHLWGDIPTWLATAGGVIAFVLGRREYRDAQQWKRSEFLAAEVDRFFAQSRVATALLLIDYSEIALDATGQRARARTADTVVLTDAVITRALRIHTEFSRDTEKFDLSEMVAREAFDEILTGFERFAHHVKIGLIDVAAAKVYLGYWAEKLADPRSQWKPNAFYSALARFVEAYQYRGAAQLFEDFGHALPKAG